MVGGAPSRAGHSIPELIVALAFLSVGLGSVAAAGLTGSVRSQRSALAARALSAASALADSLALAAADGRTVETGTVDRGPWVLTWRPAAPGIEISARPAVSDGPVFLYTFPLATESAPPEWPWS